MAQSKGMETTRNSDYLIQHHTRIIAEIGRIFITRVHLRELLGEVISLVASETGLERGSITIYNRETNDISIDASYGYTSHEVERGRYKPGEGVVGTVISSGKPIVIPSIAKEPLFLNRTGAHDTDYSDNYGFICVPIGIDNEVIGTITAEKVNDTGSDLSGELNILTVVSVMIAHAVNDRRVMLQKQAQMEEENRLLRIRLSRTHGQHRLVGNSHVMEDLYEKILLVSPTSTTVLITGETGTGKELIADAIYENGSRKDQPYIKVNIAALPDSLIESELFGHERGAFTGAIASKKGRFEMANGGTIFLDEIGDLKPELQVKLLRTLQEKSIERIGGTKSVPLDVRIIAATHQNLEERIGSGEFRQDLYYRLNVFPIMAPSLRDRKSDVMLLADHFLEKYNREIGKNVKRISSEAIDMLVSYHWPGNVRELENCMQRAVILTTEDVIRSYHLPPSLQMAENPAGTGTGTLEALLNQYAREIIIDNLKISRGNISKAAENLGTTKRILNYKIKQLGIDYRKYRLLTDGAG